MHLAPMICSCGEWNLASFSQRNIVKYGKRVILSTKAAPISQN